MLLRRHIPPPPDSYVLILGIHEFHDTKIKLHRAYIRTDWGMPLFALMVNVVQSMKNIPVYGMMENLLQKMKEENHTSKMLAIVDHWMRAEL